MKTGEINFLRIKFSAFYIMPGGTKIPFPDRDSLMEARQDLQQAHELFKGAYPLGIRKTRTTEFEVSP